MSRPLYATDFIDWLGTTFQQSKASFSTAAAAATTPCSVTCHAAPPATLPRAIQSAATGLTRRRLQCGHSIHTRRASTVEGGARAAARSGCGRRNAPAATGMHFITRLIAKPTGRRARARAFSFCAFHGDMSQPTTVNPAHVLASLCCSGPRRRYRYSKP